MKILEKPFVLEEWWSKYIAKCPYKLGSSGCQEISVKEIMDFSNKDYCEVINHTWFDTDPKGSDLLCELIAAQYKTKTVDEVISTHGGSEAIYILYILLGSNKNAVVIKPCYESISVLAEHCCKHVDYYQLEYKNKWEVDLEKLKSKITKDTDLLFMNFPNNPTGAIITNEQLVDLTKHCESVGCKLINDEVFLDITYDTDQPRLRACDISENNISLGTMTKSFGLPGIRIGWIAADKKLIEQVRRIKSYITLAEASMSEFCSICSFQVKDKIYALQRERYITNLKKLKSLKEFLDFEMPKAGVCCFAKPKEGIKDSIEFQRRLAVDYGVFVVPGESFGFPDFFRLGFGVDTGMFDTGAERIKQAVQDLKGKV